MNDTRSSRGPLRRFALVAALLALLAVLAAIFGPRFLTEEKPAHEHAEHKGNAQYWTCGMHPWVILPEPGPCPICGMDLVPLDPKKFSGDISINPVVVQNMGVRIAEVTEGPLVKSIRTVGIVAYDEENVRDVNTKISGWIEDIFVDSLGAPVRAGEPLFSVYSPQLYSAQEDYLIARRGGDRSLIDATRTRLEYFDVTPAQIDALVKRGKPEKSLRLPSPFDGIVTEKHANEGMKIDPGMQVYRIADLSKVWVLVTVYEYQLPFIEEGQDAVMTLTYVPGQTFEGKVVYVYPYLDKMTREVQVRLVFDNPGGLLKPGMFANVELRNQLAAKKTLVPRSAVIDTGTRQVAFVSLGEGKFEPRKVQTGVTTDGGKIEVVSGLKPGEMVVTSGQFLLDSESNMREALAKMIKGEPAADQKVDVSVKSQEPLTTLPASLGVSLTDALDAYLAIQTALANDTIDDVAGAAQSLVDAVAVMRDIPVPDHPHFWHLLSDALATIKKESASLTGATDLAQARLAFGPLSVGFRSLLAATGVPPGYSNPVFALHCPMFKRDQGGTVWIQAGEEARNPYMGSAMLGCFDDRRVIPITGGGKK